MFRDNIKNFVSV